MKKRFLIFSLLIFLPSFFSAQNGSADLKSDSLNTVILSAYAEKIQKIEQQHLTDSLKKTELELQLNTLKTTDNLKKEQLLKQIQELNEKDLKRIEQKKSEIDSLRATVKGFPVKGFFNDTLFMVYSRLGSFSAKERAEAINERVQKLKGVYRYNNDSLKLIEAETTVDIVYAEDIITSITENDAIWNNTNKSALAKKYKNKVEQELFKYGTATNAATLVKNIGLALLVLIVLAIIIFYLNRFFRWLASKIQQQENKRIIGIKIKNYTLFDAKRQVNALLALTNFIRWVLILLLVYLTLPTLFSIFPWTKGFTGTLLGYILNPLKKMTHGIWNYLPNLFTIIVIIVVFRYVIKGFRFLKTEIEKGRLKLPGFYTDWANPTYQIIRIIIWAFMIVVIFPYLPGSDSHIFQGVSVFLGFLFTFSSAGSLSNIVAGLVITYMRLFNIGDRVKIGDITGDVIEKSLLVTRIRTIKNEIISVPNSTVMNNHTINYCSDAPEKGLIIHTTVTIGYDAPWKKVHEALIDAALKTNLILEEPTPFVLQTSLDDFYVSYQINAYTKEPNMQANIYSDLHQNIQDSCNERGIEILSPHYRAARDGNMTTIPENYLGKDYKAPGFNVNINK
ncbi:MAG: mechanosensitive ion channel [Bacteroidetes bacterium]|nr:mechanosensitive ion channel [Bacteroidota bacterium]